MRIFHTLTSSCTGSWIRRNRNVFHVVKMDGEVVEFTAPVLVEELLVKFQGFGVKSSRKSSELLPPSFELQMGRKYYLFPNRDTDQAKSCAEGVCEKAAAPGAKRIKVVITKKQLEELLSKKTSAEEVILGIGRACWSGSGVCWKPSLVSIPEEDEKQKLDQYV